MSVERVEQFSKRYQQPAVCALLPVSTTPVTTQVEIESAPTVTVEETSGEEKRRESTQWKPRTGNATRAPPREVIDYTDENSDPDGSVSFCMPFVHSRVRPQKVFAVMRSPYVNIDGEKIQVNFGFIERIDFIERRDGNKTYFIHLADGRFNKNADALNILERMREGERFKVYNDREQNYFWWMSISKANALKTRVEETDGTSADITFDLQ